MALIRRVVSAARSRPVGSFMGDAVVEYTARIVQPWHAGAVEMTAKRKASRFRRDGEQTRREVSG